MIEPPSGNRPLTSRRHPLIRRIRRMAARPAIARREACFLLDGVHLCEEALDAGRIPEVLLCAPRLERTASGRDLLRRAHSAAWPMQPITDDILAAIALTNSPQGVLGLFRRPPTAAPQALERLARGAAPSSGSRAVRILGLDGVQDPVNLGVLARAAWAFGCHGLLTLPETVDPFHPRALRASSGMLLRLALATDVPADQLISWSAAEHLRIVRLATQNGMPLDTLAPAERPILLLVGSEGQGFSREVADLAAEDVTIEIRPQAESLGVAAAGAIAIYALGAASRRS